MYWTLALGPPSTGIVDYDVLSPAGFWCLLYQCLDLRTLSDIFRVNIDLSSLCRLQLTSSVGVPASLVPNSVPSI